MAGQGSLFTQSNATSVFGGQQALGLPFPDMGSSPQNTSSKLIGRATRIQNTAKLRYEQTRYAFNRARGVAKASGMPAKLGILKRVFGRTLRAVGSVGLRRAPLLTIGLAALGVGAMRGLYEGAEAPYMPALDAGAYKPRRRGMQSNHLNTEGLTLALHKNRHRA